MVGVLGVDGTGTSTLPAILDGCWAIGTVLLDTDDCEFLVFCFVPRAFAALMAFFRRPASVRLSEWAVEVNLREKYVLWAARPGVSFGSL